MTAVGMRLEINGLDVDGWTATLVDLDANVEWFDATGPDPLTAASRLLEVVGTAYSAQGRTLTKAAVLIGDLRGELVADAASTPKLLERARELLEGDDEHER